ncbi:PREDICTED: uncharacterized protein LOC107341454 isoform X2 [Acropora digitifera]|uniref:uncharacterized protein LOC107341454 isoform X2 n=1 Tax=Acropora digitifera TaxID=70779 RepID=UPI00077A4E26|nr:PREDICTED: uncharacterized protein LOC107341454 isoform X2 [Acropora digitifera]
MDYNVDVKALKATFLVKEEVQDGVFKPRGIACAVYFKEHIFLLTSSAVVKATDDRKKHIAERFSRKHFGDYRLDVSILGQLGDFTFLRIVKEHPTEMGTAWIISLNLELPSLERKALGRPLSGTGEFQLQVQWVGKSTNIQVITTKSIEWTSILGVPIIIENMQSNKRQSGRFSVIGVVGLTSEEKLCLCYLDHLDAKTGSLDMLLSKQKGAKGRTDIKELVEEETPTAPAQAIAAINLHEQGASAILETEDQHSWSECRETSTAPAQGIAAINLHEQGASAIVETEVQRYLRECGEAIVKLLIVGKSLEKEKQEVVEEMLTQAVHNYVRFNSCSKDDPCQGLKAFTEYLTQAYALSLLAVCEGSLVIILGCHTLKGLELLWRDYRSGHLDEVAERYLATEEVKRKLNLVTICLKTVIEEDNYSNCRKALMKRPSRISGEYKQNVREI